MKKKNDKYNFQQFGTIKSFTRNIFNNKIILDEVDKDPIELLIQIRDLKIIQNQKTAQENNKKEILLKAFLHFLLVQKCFLMVLKLEYSQ